MIGHLLLYLLVSDLRDFSDNDLYETLEVLVGCPVDEAGPVLDELRESILDQLQAEHLDRNVIATWPEDFCELLPEQMLGYPACREQFERLLGQTACEPEDEENDRLARFRLCLDLLEADCDWKQRSLGARRLGSLEEELFSLRDAAANAPLRLDECVPATVIAHRQLLRGFDLWQAAFRLTHQGELDQAFEQAQEASRLFQTVATWSNLEPA